MDLEHADLDGFSPPFKPEWQSKVDAALAAQPARHYCGEGMPSIMYLPAPVIMFELLMTPKVTAMIFSHQQIRHIYTDGRSHPAPRDLLPSVTGDSIGHWEGDTLIVDTIAPDNGFTILAPVEYAPGKSVPTAVKDAPSSAQLRFTERIRLVSPNRLKDELVIEDPEALTKAWRFNLEFARVTDMDRLIFDDDCGANDRNPIVEGRLTTLEHSLPEPTGKP